jgi:hypothetical protein
MDVRELSCHKICEALRVLTGVRILQELIKAYPSRLAIFKRQEITSEPRMSMWFHINRVRESNLVELDRSRRCFKAATRVLARLNGNGILL